MTQKEIVENIKLLAKKSNKDTILLNKHSNSIWNAFVSEIILIRLLLKLKIINLKQLNEEANIVNKMRSKMKTKKIKQRDFWRKI